MQGGVHETDDLVCLVERGFNLGNRQFRRQSSSGNEKLLFHSGYCRGGCISLFNEHWNFDAERSCQGVENPNSKVLFPVLHGGQVLVGDPRALRKLLLG